MTLFTQELNYISIPKMAACENSLVIPDILDAPSKVTTGWLSWLRLTGNISTSQLPVGGPYFSNSDDPQT